MFEGLAHVGHWENEQDANWKVLVENFNECYHCPVAHPQFSRLLAVDPDHYALETARWTSRAVVPLRPGGAQAVADYPEGGNELGAIRARLAGVHAQPKSRAAARERVLV